MEFLAGGGEMGELIRAHDWTKTPLGPPETWPQSLRLTVRLMLNSNHPMFIWWGPQLIQLYNDAYRQTMGPEMHPQALGMRGRESWADIWDIIGPQIELVMAGRGATWNEEALVPIHRHGRREDVWWTYGYSPIDEEGGVGGVLVVCTDVTEQHLTREALRDHSQRLEQQFERAPGFIAVVRGPDYVFELANAAYRKLVGGRDVVGRKLIEALPEVEQQGFVTLLDEVRRSGKPHIGRRVPVSLQSEGDETMREMFLDFIYQPMFEANGEVSGVFVEGSDVTDHVRAETHLRLVNDELKHRVKNTLAMVSAIASQTLRGTEASDALTAFHQRLATFARAHDILTANAWATADIRDVIDTALSPHIPDIRRLRLNGPPMLLGAKQALSMALALHELGTNAVKYGALANDRGTISIEWSSDPETFHLSWREQDGRAVTEPKRRGFGSRLVERVLAADFGGVVDIRYPASGLQFDLKAPLANLGNLLPSPFLDMEQRVAP